MPPPPLPPIAIALVSSPTTTTSPTQNALLNLPQLQNLPQFRHWDAAAAATAAILFDL